VDWLLNEGAGAVIPFGDRRLYGVCCAEKGTVRFRVRARGRAGHASVPALADNALLKLLPALERLGTGRAEYDLVDAPRAFLEALGEDPADPAGAVARLGAADARIVAMLEPMLGATFAPTLISAGEKINVIPARAEFAVDCRLPPGLGADVAERRAREVLGDADGLELDFTEAVPGNGSAPAGELMDAIGAWIRDEDPAGEAVPFVLPAFTDSRWFRAAFPDCVAYGFFPQRHQDLYTSWPLMHSADERLDVRDLGFATRFFADLPRRLLS
jgi:acetylornithine deacetylase/succinyl-diaminopimelate desuccinylase-like protein